MNYRTNTMISSIAMRLNEMSMVESLRERLEQYINENKFSVYAFGRAGNYFGVETGIFIPESNKEFSNLKDCILYILRENRNLVFRMDEGKYIPGIYFNDNSEASVYMENNEIAAYFDIDKSEMVDEAKNDHRVEIAYDTYVKCSNAMGEYLLSVYDRDGRTLLCSVFLSDDKKYKTTGIQWERGILKSDPKRGLEIYNAIHYFTQPDIFEEVVLPKFFDKE